MPSLGNYYLGMNRIDHTSIAMSEELAEWLARQSRIRDCTASSLMRSLLRAAQQETAPADLAALAADHRDAAARPGQPAAQARPPGRYRDPAGRFMPE